MEIIIHRVNTIKELKEIDKNYGAEIDIRSWGKELVLNHEPFQSGEKLVTYLDEYNHGTLVLNIKEAGIEDEVLQLIRNRPQITSYFLLDVEFPYLYRATRRGERNIAIRYSEDESIETVKKYVGMVDWVWIDTYTKIPITNKNRNVLDEFNKCLVCPERWGRPNDIIKYGKKIFKLNFSINSIMTSLQYSKIWCDEILPEP